ncbi:MAG TPA: dephospho-CoA kinase [Firmicutes bacterium]|nr:dephospho-CoA kinase [Bacillota bacterium]
MLDKVYVVGLTGPTGSGKSEVSRRLAAAQLPVIDADVLARRVVEPGSECLRRLAAEFSEDILNEDGTLNRRQLAKRAFATPEDTALLNALTHPYIIEETHRILMRMEQTHELAAVIDAPLLFESGMDRICDITVAVVAPFESRLRRIMERDGLPETQARARMAAQQPEDYYSSRAAVVLSNGGDLASLRARADDLAARIREWANDR